MKCQRISGFAAKRRSTALRAYEGLSRLVIDNTLGPRELICLFSVSCCGHPDQNPLPQRLFHQTRFIAAHGNFAKMRPLPSLAAACISAVVASLALNATLALLLPKSLTVHGGKEGG